MTLICKPPLFRAKPADATHPTVFLAGSIEMGKAENWQEMLTQRIENSFSIIFNPRRDAWDSSWKQSIDSPEFNVQVNWELEMIERADILAFYFDPNTISPITLAELGLACGTKPWATHVCCPEGFHRKGNVDIMCERYGIRTYKSLRDLADGLIAAGDDYLAEDDVD